MSRLVECILATALVAAALGCCAGPCRFYQNAYGWNNPDTEAYCPGSPAPVTTPPGYSSPVVPDEVIARTGRTSPGVNVPRDAAPPTEVLPEALPEAESSPPKETPPNDTPTNDAPTSLLPTTVVPASYTAPTRLPSIVTPVDDAKPAAFPRPTWSIE